MIKSILVTLLLLNTAPAFAAFPVAGFDAVRKSTTTGTAERRLAGLFCASVSSAVWDTCTVQWMGRIPESLSATV